MTGTSPLSKSRSQDENLSAGKIAPISTAEFMAKLAQQEQSQRAAEIREGRLVPAVELARRLSLTPQAIRKACKAKRMFALRSPSGSFVYPAFFAAPGLDRKQLESISVALGSMPDAAKWGFFISPRISLRKKTPLHALEKGEFDAVMRAAQIFAAE